MEYLDIYDQLGGVKQERFPSPGFINYLFKEL
jgi:hypothetical protein